MTDDSIGTLRHSNKVAKNSVKLRIPFFDILSTSNRNAQINEYI